MIANPQLTHWDRCQRLWQYLDQYQALRVTPLGSLYESLHVVLQAKSGAYTGPEMARSWVMEQASKRGVQTDKPNPYDIMVNHSYLAEVLARVLRQPTSEELFKHEPIGDYEPESYLVDGGMRLMRFVLVDYWNENRCMAELHSWRTVADVCVTQLPMTIRVLVIGTSVNGKRVSPWTRGSIHPFTKQLKFRRKGSKDELAGNWRKVWREESNIPCERWIEQMARDGILRDYAFDIKVKVPDQLQSQRVVDDIKRIRWEQEASRGMQEQFPMNRSACDDQILGPCRFQVCCYAPMELLPDETGLFERRQPNVQRRGKKAAS